MQEDLLAATTGKEERKITYRIVSAVEAGEKVDVPVEFATIMLKITNCARSSRDDQRAPGRRARADTRVGVEERSLTLLNQWLNESKSHTKSSESLLLTMRMLELLLAIPTDLPALRASGIPRTLKNRFQTHENGRLRVLARQRGHRWMQALSRKSGRSTADRRRRRGTGENRRRARKPPVLASPCCSAARAERHVVDEPKDGRRRLRKMTED